MFVRKVVAFFGSVFLAMAFMVPALMAQEAQALFPSACDNLSVKLIRYSDLVSTDSGYMRVFYNGSTKKVCVESYDDSFNVKDKKSLALELDYWGGFYAGKDAYYLAQGRNNKTEDDAAEVIRVIKYDKSWKRLGAASITGNTSLFGGEVRYPFDYGNVEFAERNGKLYLVTGHEGYVDPAYNQGHQGFLMIEVDEATMQGKIVDCDLWHSFAQYIEEKDGYLYVLEQSEGSRYAKLSRCPGVSRDDRMSIFDYGGVQTSAWAIPCYATVDGLALSSTNVLSLGTSIDQSRYDDDSPNPYNVYLTVTPMDNFTKDATQVKWLTNFSGEDKSVSGAKITKVNDNRFIVSWGVRGESQKMTDNDLLSTSVLHYVFVDGNGNKASKEFTAAAPLSGCQPIVKGSKIVYYASNDNMLNFYSIDSSSGVMSKKSYRLAGENATWTLSGSTLTISGSGAMAETAGEDSGWSEPAWSAFDDIVKKVVVKGTITSVSAEAFAYLSKLETVVFEEGVKKIGAKALYGCESLKRIEIPASVTSIGEDLNWDGYYWTFDESHVYRGTIYAPKGSYALKYAKNNGMSYTATETGGASGATSSGDSAAGGSVADGSDVPAAPKVGVKLTDAKTKSVYKVTKAGKSVAFTGTKNKKATTVTIPATVKFGGVTYKVTSVTANALKGYAKLKKLTIGKNVTKIGAKAFYGCTKLTSVSVKSSALTAKSVGGKAFANAGKSNYKKLVVSVPAKKLSAYKGLFVKKGLSKKARVKK